MQAWRPENDQNPGWGTPEETFRKVEEFYKTDRLDTAPPIEGALEGLLKRSDIHVRGTLDCAHFSAKNEAVDAEDDLKSC